MRAFATKAIATCALLMSANPAHVLAFEKPPVTQRFLEPRGRWEFRYPPGWHVDFVQDDPTTAIWNVFSKGNAPLTDSEDWFNVNFIINDEGPETLELLRQSLCRGGEFQEKFFECGVITIHGRKWAFSYTLHYADFRTRSLSYGTVAGGRTFLATGATTPKGDYQKRLGLIRDIVRTFELHVSNDSLAQTGPLNSLISAGIMLILSGLVIVMFASARVRAGSSIS